MIETGTKTWTQIKAVLDEGIKACRGKLEQQGLPMAETEYERGRLSVFRDIRALGDPPVVDHEKFPTGRTPLSDRSGI
jgi:hypothetical protein